MGIQQSTYDVSAAFPFPLLHCYLVLSPTRTSVGCGRVTTAPEPQASFFTSFFQPALVGFRSVSLLASVIVLAPLLIFTQLSGLPSVSSISNY